MKFNVKFFIKSLKKMFRNAKKCAKKHENVKMCRRLEKCEKMYFKTGIFGTLRSQIG